MSILPIEKMRERVKIARQDSDTSYFLSLLYFGEMIIKLTGAGLVSAIENDPDRNRYRIIHRLVRADGLGDWSASIEDMLSGPSSRFLDKESVNEQQELITKCGTDSWQYQSSKWLNKCLQIIDPNAEQLQTRIQGKKWLTLFVTLRNSTRGHGAPLSEICTRMCFPLEESIEIFIDNFALFKRPWLYLHKNLSGKYKSINLSNTTTDKELSGIVSNIEKLDDGIYIKFNELRKAELVFSSVDGIDFFFPNGGFNKKKFKTISYLSNNSGEIDASPYLAPASFLPKSETQGIGYLEVVGNCFTNIPSLQDGYIIREDLENSLKTSLLNDRHPIVTLLGRGGIGKTSLALKILRDISIEDRFSIILWFSARDVDLFQEGPKIVSPQILSIEDISNEYVRLVQPSQLEDKRFNSIEHFSKVLGKNEFGNTLYVFDNFETVQNPLELYNWIDTYIRLPNKVLITTRLRDFKGDYPIEVLGMDNNQSKELINQYSNYLGIKNLLTEKYKLELIVESEGHPYVMKVLLGEVAKENCLLKVERIIATKDDILDALFERTYNGLSQVGRRVFLTLCNWRSTVPLIGLEAVLLRSNNERMDVDKAVEELGLCSFVEIHQSPKDDMIFLNIPMVASVFGRKKLATDPLKSSIELDNQLLFAFGASQTSEISRGIGPKIERLFRYVAKNISQGKATIDTYIPMLEFLARRHPDSWLLLARLYQELNKPDNAKEAIRRFLESTPKDYDQQEKAWNNLSNLCHFTNDYMGEISSLVELCKLEGIPFEIISNAVNRVNALFINRSFTIDSEEKKVISQTLAEIMASRIVEGDATDCSRLAWLYLRIQEEDKAFEIVERGLKIDNENDYCINLYNQKFRGN
ncbi:hypothetical protein KKF04_01350 [Patescibacteria group bacterium]|nr:hypothetical protein [Patescibacteria group bacterium]